MSAADDLRELRDGCKEPGQGWDDDELRVFDAVLDDLTSARAEIERLTALIKRLEWGSCDGCGQGGHCPICTGQRPPDRFDGDDDSDYELEYYGHKPDCPQVQK